MVYFTFLLCIVVVHTICFFKDRGSIELIPYWIESNWTIFERNQQFYDNGMMAHDLNYHVKDTKSPSRMRLAIYMYSWFILVFSLATFFFSSTISNRLITSSVLALMFALGPVFLRFSGNLYQAEITSTIRKGQGIWYFRGFISSLIFNWMGFYFLLQKTSSIWIGLLCSGSGYIILTTSTLIYEHFQNKAQNNQDFLSDLTLPEGVILYLRSFSDDSIKVYFPVPFGEGHSLRYLLLPRTTYEVALASMLIRSNIGKVVGIGNPAHHHNTIGAFKTFVFDTDKEKDRWKKEIQRISNQVDMILVVSGTSGGLTWEKEKLEEWGLLSKTLFLFPPVLKNTQQRILNVLDMFEVPSKQRPEFDFYLDSLPGIAINHSKEVTWFLYPGRDWYAYYFTIMVFYFEKTKGRAYFENGVNLKSSEKRGKRPRVIPTRIRKTLSKVLKLYIKSVKTEDYFEAIQGFDDLVATTQLSDSEMVGVLYYYQEVLSEAQDYLGAMKIGAKLLTIIEDETWVWVWIARAIESEEIRMDVLKTAVYCGEKLGDSQAEEAYYEQMLELAKKFHMRVEIATSCMELGRMCVTKQDYETAIDYLLEAVDTFEKIGDSPSLGDCYVYLGTSYFYLNQFEEAKDSAYLAAKFFEQIERYDLAALQLGNVSKMYDKLGEEFLADKYRERAQASRVKGKTESD